MSLRRSLLIALLGAVLVVPPATARPEVAGIELAKGSGRAVLSLRGAVLGSVDRGRLTVRLTGTQTQWKVEGHDWSRRLPSGEVVYGGAGIRFRFFRGSWRLVVQGDGINASAVGKGTVVLRGTGTYALGGGAPRPWPASATTLRLGVQQGRSVTVW